MSLAQMTLLGTPLLTYIILPIPANDLVCMVDTGSQQPPT